MTRINTIDPSILTDKHLLAEYKEITRPFNKVINRIEKHGINDALTNCKIPERYTLGSGHETFFFNKLEWLYNRYLSLYRELKSRSFNVNSEAFKEISTAFLKLAPTPYWNSYEPSPEDHYLNMVRICIRSNLDTVNSELIQINFD